MMLIGDIITDGIGLLSRQLKFYCWHYRRDLDSKQRQELLDLLNERYFEKLASKIKSLTQSNIVDCKQQIGKLLFEQCLVGHRRNQLIQLIESDLVDINVRLDNYGRTLLHRTSYNLDVELVRLLIDHGVNIRLRDYAGNTALHIAIQSYRNGALIYNNEPEVVQNLTSIIELLLEADKKALKKRIKLEVPSNSSESIRGSNTNQSLEKDLNLSKKDGIHKIEQSTPAGQQLKLVTHQDSRPTNNNTLCRIIGLTCSCREQNQGQKSDNHLHESPVDDASMKLESHKSEAVPMRGKLTNIKSESPSSSPSNALMDEDSSVSLVDTKNAFGRTALHYCVLVVGEQHLDHFVSLLIAYDADVNVVDTRLKTPLYCLIKRPGVSAVRQKCLAMTRLIENGSDDLGLALDQPGKFFSETVIKSLESKIAESLSKAVDEHTEPIFTRTTFKRVPSLKHLVRLALIRTNDSKNGGPRRQTSFLLPPKVPDSLNIYMNRRILDQSELF